MMLKTFSCAYLPSISPVKMPLLTNILSLLFLLNSLYLFRLVLFCLVLFLPSGVSFFFLETDILQIETQIKEMNMV